MTTSELVTIGQVWRRVKRRQPRLVGEIKQVHRADKQVVLMVSGERMRVEFSELRKHWRLED
jgi:hypothetical protein